ncbi:coiled-coil and C2 domain-containing protein 2A [Harpegnathos saltator]|uniref:Coiled-coil and C2 domain-containing protein 2A n=1 Tax=Harpegnathos saltator TaxID=610380 RepID=E2BVV1_HARSA|nr:coiled-coil and C2 domain-containing protein 2A [Harpegnathos saltator]EFN80180.1 Coiled-coil and C2 domain-containing protein 2A [Harpegnathos saltator]
MSSPQLDFISGLGQQSDASEQDLSLCYAYPEVDDDRETSSVLSCDKEASRAPSRKDTSADDGLYVPENPFTDKIIKPYRLNNVRMLDYESREEFRGRLVEIAIRDVRIHEANTPLQIASVSILFKRKPICRTKQPFNRKLYKLLIRNMENHNLSIQVHAQRGESSVLPLPLPRRCVKDHKVDIDFAIGDSSGRIYAGTVTSTVSVSKQGDDEREEESDVYFYTLSNDPNDPQNCLSLRRPSRRQAAKKEDVKYFSLQDPALIFDTELHTVRKSRSQEYKPPDIVVTEQPAFSVLDVSLKNFFQASRPLRPSSSARRHRTIGKTILSVSVLRGVEVPVREESASVSPLLEVEWGDVVHATSVAEGPAPVWQQTMHFELPRQNGERCVKFRLYDQHPVWGQQWLGEARVPLERQRNHQELERWLDLSPLFSPVLLFGYVQASPGQSHTRIYVLMKMEQRGNSKSMEADAIDTLSKGIQRCLATPYKVAGVETPGDAARFSMLLPALPVHYGPVTPRQVLNVNKVDHYGRAALLATLLQGFGLHSYVLLGSSQISKWTAFVLNIEGDDATLWDPEVGDHYELSDSRCSLTKVSRLINHSGIWENLQKSILPHNLRYNVANSKDWRPLAPVATSASHRSVQTLEPAVADEEDVQAKESAAQMEQHLRDKLSSWRSALGLTTVFNRHAVAVLRTFVSSIPSDVSQQVDKKDLKQLYRAYHTHGFLLNLRQASLDELTEQIAATKVRDISGPVEFALVCHVQRYVGKTCSVWLALAILRSRG